MTSALCLNCGNIKWGAFNRCRVCGYEPKKDEYDNFLLATTHNYDIGYLESRGKEIQNGEIPKFDDPRKVKREGLLQRIFRVYKDRYLSIVGFFNLIKDTWAYMKDTWAWWVFFVLPLVFLVIWQNHAYSDGTPGVMIIFNAFFLLSSFWVLANLGKFDSYRKHVKEMEKISRLGLLAWSFSFIFLLMSYFALYLIVIGFEKYGCIFSSIACFSIFSTIMGIVDLKKYKKSEIQSLHFKLPATMTSKNSIFILITFAVAMILL